MFAKPLSALALFVAYVSALRISVPDQGDRGAVVYGNFTWEQGDGNPSTVDLFLSGVSVQGTYAISYNFPAVSDDNLYLVLPFVVDPGQQYKFVAWPSGLMYNRQIYYGESNNITIN